MAGGASYGRGMDLGLSAVVALVVGGGGLIGSAVGRALHAEGATVVLGGRTQQTLSAAAEAIGADVQTVVLDSGDDDSVRRAVEGVVARHGSVGVLVNTAAPSARTLDPARNSDPEQVTQAFEAKAMGYLRCANAVLPGMREAGFGRVINISGQNAFLTASVTGAVRNGAVAILSKALADECAGSGVTVNVVHPGIVRPDAATEVEAGAPGESTPAQVAAVVVFLASRAAGAVSGESVAVGHRVRGVSAY